MATVGQQLQSPETSWRRIEDTDSNLLYNGTWRMATETYHTNNTGCTTYDVNATVKFRFYGTKIRLISNKYSNKPNNVKIIIDGVTEYYSQSETVNPLNTAYTYYILTYEKTGLNLGVHEVEISCPDLATNFNWNIDAIDIDDNGYLLNYYNVILLKSNNQYYSINDAFYDITTRTYIPLTEADVLYAFDKDDLTTEKTITIDTETNETETFIPITKFTNIQLITDDPEQNFSIQGQKYTKQLIVASDDIPASIASNIDSFTLTSTKTTDADIRLALSIDKGLTWKTYNTTTLLFEDLVDCTIPLKPYETLTADELIQWNSAMDNIYHNGITPDVFNTLDFNILNADYIRFAYVLNKPTYADTVETSQLDWQFDAKGSMRKMSDSEHYIDVYEHKIKITTLIDSSLIKVNVIM